MWFFKETIDFKNYPRKEDLIGYQEAQGDFRDWLDAQNGKTLDPPSERPGFLEESARKDEEIKRWRVSG